MISDLKFILLFYNFVIFVSNLRNIASNRKEKKKINSTISNFKCHSILSEQYYQKIFNFIRLFSLVPDLSNFFFIFFLLDLQTRYFIKSTKVENLRYRIRISHGTKPNVMYWFLQSFVFSLYKTWKNIGNIVNRRLVKYF